MKNRLIGYTDITTLFNEHLRREAKVWEELRQSLYDSYIAQGYLEGFAVVKANNDILALRQKPKNVLTLNIPKEFTKDGDLD